MMNTYKIAKQIAETLKMPRAYKYDLFLREFDNMVEVVGLVDDPNYDMKDFQGREMLFPKKWVTIGVVDASYEVRV
jgi:hypothetical protein